MPEEVVRRARVARPIASISALNAPKKIIDYEFSDGNLANPDGKLPSTVTGGLPVAGPGTTVMGDLPGAMHLNASGAVRLSLPATDLNHRKFCVRIAFRADSPVTGRQNLIESSLLPFSLFIDKGRAPDSFIIAATVGTLSYGWAGATTEWGAEHRTGTWYVADLAYDGDTLELFVNGAVVGVHAFPAGKLQTLSGTELFIGTWVDGARNHFTGAVAGVQLWAGIPEEIEALLDDQRSGAEWAVTRCYEGLKPRANLGRAATAIQWSGEAQAYAQRYEHGVIHYREDVGAAFGMYGAIYQYYLSLSAAERQALGYLTSNEMNTTKPGGRKSLFSKGAIYWSPATGAKHVVGQVYLNYEEWGESAFLGWPTSAATSISGGKEQVFQGGRMYLKNGGTSAFEVHGAILQKFLTSGGVSTWGFPVTNEMDVRKNGAVIGKSSQFENCTIYWSASTGAFEVHGDIRARYETMNGPCSDLGFPTSDEGSIPGAGGARYNTFQNGSILWFGSSADMNVCYPFRIYLGRVATQESEGFAMGQNDLYMRTKIHDNGAEIFNRRFPNSGDYGGNNSVNIEQQLAHTIVPNRTDRVIKFTVDVWESDGGAPFGGGDDHLGIHSTTLNMANAWGLRNNNGVFNTGNFSKVNSVTWSVQPQVNVNNLTDVEKWWGVQNAGTPTLTYNQYAQAFRDVDSETEWWDVSDWLEKAFYELVTKGLAANGNCFGMSLEAIYAWKHRSLFSLPINRFNAWNTVVNEFNLKHQYQVGASAIWWFVGQFLSGNTHDPVDVFNNTRREFMRGNNPVVCIAQNWDFSGAPHCVLPFRWDTSSSPWKMHIYDPNFPNTTKIIEVNPTQNTFKYNGSSNYTGGEWSGGRFHYMPWDLLCERPRTPIWDAILLILAGTVIILGDDAETVSLTDANGNDLSIFSKGATDRMKAGESVPHRFFPVKGFDAAGKKVIASEMFLRKEAPSLFRINPDAVSAGINLSSIATLRELMTDRRFASSAASLSSDPAAARLMNRRMSSIAADKNLMASLSPAAATAIQALSKSLVSDDNFIHHIKGKKAGHFKYAVKHRFREFMLQSGIASAEAITLGVDDIGKHDALTRLTTVAGKTVSLELSNKLGTGKDRVRYTIDKIPASAGKALEISMRPGFSGLDIMAGNEKVEAVMTMETEIDGVKKKSTFGVELEGGTRIRPSLVESIGELQVGKIDNVLGQVRGVKNVKAK